MYLGVDVGTGSTKAVLATADGAVLASAVREHPLDLPAPGRAEADPELWWQELGDLSRELLAGRDAAQLAGICVSGMGPALVLTDDDLHPVRPAILYGIDTRAEAQIDALNRDLGADRILAETGKALSSQAIGPKLRWVREHEPEVFGRARRMFSTHSYLVARLTGEDVLDHHTASQWAPMYDLAAREWHARWAPPLAGGLPLPRLVWSDEVVGAVTPQAARQTGLPAGVPVCGGTVDAWAEAISAGVREPGDTMVMYGSTMFFVQVLDQERIDELLWTTPGVSAATLTLAAGTSTGGSLIGWARELFGQPPYEDLLAELAQVPAGADGLLVLPYFAGERTPIFDPKARGVLIGLTLRHRRAHVLKAAYEGIAYGVRHILERMEQSAPVGRLVAVGGGTQSRPWLQAVSDVTGLSQVVPRERIGAAYGDALLAAIATGAVPPGTSWAVPDHVVRPDPRLRARYDELYELYTSAYPALRPTMHALTDLDRG